MAHCSLWLENELSGPDGAIKITLPADAHVSDIAREAAQVMAFGRAVKASEVQVCRYPSQRSVSNRDGVTPLFQSGDTVWVQVRGRADPVKPAAKGVPAIPLLKTAAAAARQPVATRAYSGSPPEHGSPGPPSERRAAGTPLRARGGAGAGTPVAGSRKASASALAREREREQQGNATPRVANANYTPRTTAATQNRAEATRLRREEVRAKEDPLKKRWGVVGGNCSAGIGKDGGTFGQCPAPPPKKRSSPEPAAADAPVRVPVPHDDAPREPPPSAATPDAPADAVLHGTAQEEAPVALLASTSSGGAADERRSVRSIAATYDAGTAGTLADGDVGDDVCDVSPQSDVAGYTMRGCLVAGGVDVADDGQTVDVSATSRASSQDRVDVSTTGCPEDCGAPAATGGGHPFGGLMGHGAAGHPVHLTPVGDVSSAEVSPVQRLASLCLSTDYTAPAHLPPGGAAVGDIDGDGTTRSGSATAEEDDGTDRARVRNDSDDGARLLLSDVAHGGFVPIAAVHDDAHAAAAAKEVGGAGDDDDAAAPAILWHERFRAFYALHNKEKIDGVDDLLARNPANEDRVKLWDMLLRKYDVTEDTWRGVSDTYEDEY